MSSTQNTVVESQLRLARAALEDGLRSSAGVRAEAVLADYPAVAGDTEAALELVYTEFAVRENLGQNPDPADWYARFPHWRTDLEQMFEVHRELKKEDARRQSRSRPTGVFHPPGPASSSPTVGEFEVLGEVGRGGMGVVYKARQASLGRVVAVKVILAGPHAGGRERERFKREAETAARLDHPNIVRIFAVGEHDGRPYCAMEFVDGASLADLLDGSPWADKKAAELVATAAAAAHHAHQNGVIHRDLKPANILIAGTRKPGLAHPTRAEHTPPPGSASGTTPTVKIVDFGLAKCLLDTDPGPTRTGDILGTPAYMSPEQANPAGGQVGPATDVWGLGVTLYELLVGRPPFQGATAVETLEQVRTAEPVPPRRLRPSLPRDLEVICLKCLRKDARHRYPTADALAADLTRFLRGEPIRARPASQAEHLTRWCRRNPVVAGLSVAAVMLAVAAVGLGVAAVVNSDTARRGADELANQQGAAATEQRELRLAERRRAVKLQVNEGVRLLNDGDFAGGAVILADAMANDPDPENEDLHRIRLGVTLRGMPDLRQAFGIPVHWEQNAPRRTPKGELRFPLEDVRPLVSEDGSTLVTPPDAPPLAVWDLHAGTSHPLTLENADGVDLVTLSSNGTAVVGLKGEVTLAWATATGQPLTLPLPPGFGTLPEPFTRDGARRVGGKGNSRQVYAADGTRVGKPMIHARDVMAVAVSADGTRVATATRGQGARVWDADTGAAVSPPIADDKFLLDVTLNRDGSTVYTSTVSTYQAWDVKTGQELGYQNGPVVNEVRPQCVPGGSYVATSGWESGLRVWDHQLRWVLSAPMPDTAPLVAFAFRPNGDAFVGIDRRGHARMWDPMSGTPLTPQLHAGESIRGYFSADGRRLTTLAERGAVRVWDAPPLIPPDMPAHPWHVYAAEWLPGGTEVVSVGDGGAILSRADGKVVRTFPHDKCQKMAVWPGENGRLATLDANWGVRVWDLASGRELDPAVRPPSPTRVVAFAPDGRLITGGNDGVVRFWDLTTAAQSGPPLAHDKPVLLLQVSPDGKRVLVNAVDRVCRLWDLPSGRLVRSFDVPPLTVAPAMAPDGRTLCVFTRTAVQVVSADDGTPLHTMDLDFNFRPTYSPDGRYLVSPDVEAHTVTVREVSTGRVVGRPFPHRPSNRMRTLATTAVSRDSRYLAISVDSSITVWDMVREVQVTPPIAVRYAKDMQFDDTARRLLVASVDKTVRVIDLSPDSRPVEELAERASLLANRTLAPDGYLLPLPPAEADRLWQKYRPK